MARKKPSSKIDPKDALFINPEEIGLENILSNAFVPATTLLTSALVQNYASLLEHAHHIVEGVRREGRLDSQNQGRKQKSQVEHDRWRLAAAQIISEQPSLKGPRQASLLARRILKKLGLPETKHRAVRRAIAKK